VTSARWPGGQAVRRPGGVAARVCGFTSCRSGGVACIRLCLDCGALEDCGAFGRRGLVPFAAPWLGAGGLFPGAVAWGLRSGRVFRGWTAVRSVRRGPGRMCHFGMWPGAYARARSGVRGA